MTCDKMIEEIKQIDFYKNHEYLIPSIGLNYISAHHKKLLILGESHYLPLGSTIQNDIDNWYNGKPKLSKPEKDYCCTTISRCNDTVAFTKNVGCSLENILKTKGLPVEHGFFEVASYNYFMRPAIDANTIEKALTEKDKEFALNNFIDLLDILQPNLIVFASCLAMRNAERSYKKKYNGKIVDFLKNKGIERIYTWHPSRCWNTLVQNDENFCKKTSKEFFEEWVSKKWF